MMKLATSCVTTIVLSFTFGPCFPATAAADQLPLRKGLYFPNSYQSTLKHPCLDAAIEDAWRWDGHNFIAGKDSTYVVSATLKSKAELVAGYDNPGAVYNVKTRDKPGGPVNDGVWTVLNEKNVLLNSDGFVWCADTLADLKKLRSEKHPRL